MNRYRLYLDESGDHTYGGDLDDPDRRYLGLTAVAVKTTDYRECFHPTLERLKQDVFPHSPDEPVILVRSRIAKREGIFSRLRDASVNAAWERHLLAFFADHLSVIFTVVIDKKAHRERYGRAAYHPYHYCLTVLLERYRGWLELKGGRSDVMAEGRGGTEDLKLKQVYEDIWNNGTQFLSAQLMQNAFTSKELKVKKKEQNIAGLQVADLLAYPARLDVLIRNSRGLARPPSRFTSRINETVKFKYNQYGRVFLG